MPPESAIVAPLATSSALRALINLLLGEAGLAILIVGAVGLYLLWYLRGRDRPAIFSAAYLREPPSALHPGVVGTLLDEHANAHDVVVTLVNLGVREIVRISPTARRGQPPHDYTIRLLRRDLPLSRVEHLLLDLLFGPAERPRRQTVALGTLRREFVAAVPRFKVALYDEAIAHGYFLASPRETRRRYWLAGVWVTTLALVFGLPLSCILTDFRLLLVPTITLTVIGLALCRLSRAMPVKTALGVEEAAKWQAFRRYLANIRQYEDVATAGAIFERYLPYATAFGLEQRWLKAFTHTDAVTPQWYNPAATEVTTPLSQPSRRTRRRPAQSGTTRGGAGLDAGDLLEVAAVVPGALPDLAGVADVAGGAISGIAKVASSIDLNVASEAGGAALEAASAGLGGLLDLASSILDW